MKDEILAREMSDCYSQKPLNSKSHEHSHHSHQATPSFKKPSRSFPPTQSALSNQSKTATQCCFCKGSHFADKCSKYSTLSQRKSVLGSRCFRCLGEGHDARSCQRGRSCYYCKKDSHHSSLCPSKFGAGPGKPGPADSKPYWSKNQGAVKDTSMIASDAFVQMQMATAKLVAGDRTAKARIFFDTGSSRSYVTSSLVRSLNIQTQGAESVSLAKFANTKRTNAVYKRADVVIPVADGPPITLSSLVVDAICSNIPKYPIDVKYNPILKRVPLADSPGEKLEYVCIDILVGMDHYYDFVGSEHITLTNGSLLLESKLGYIVTGKIPSNDCVQTSAVVMVCLDYPVANLDIEKFWKLEDVGIKDSPYQVDDDRAIEKFNETVRVVDGRYEVALPWKCDDDEDLDLDSNIGLAYGRVDSLMKKLKDKTKVLQEYEKTIKDQLSKGVIEQVDMVQPPDNKRVHYIPHHCIVREDKATTKLRIVYDASAKSGRNKKSLNECLLRGPVILQDLVGMLLRFRLPRIAIVSDVEKAFLQVGIQRQDRDGTRFLWPKDLSKPVSWKNLHVFRFTRVPFGFVPSPFLLGATIKHHLDRQSSQVAADICGNLYVDNVVAGRSTVSEAQHFYKEAKKLFADISMNIREWYSNSTEFSSQLPDSDKGKDTEPKILGLRWNTVDDTISCLGVEKDCDAKTKRQMLKCVSSVFDPCGLFSPIVIRGKMLVQETWRQQLSWDKPLPQQVYDDFQVVNGDLKQIGKAKIPRIAAHSTDNPSPIYEVHCFCDASAKAYAGACYLKSIHPTGVAKVTLVFCKARLAPLKSMTIPRLELMAAVIGCRMVQFVKKELRIPIERSFVWSDSKCVLRWIHSSKQLPVFVQNRVKEINSTSHVVYRYVPTTCNPADIPSRGVDLSTLQESRLWWNGPQFLQVTEDMWPENDVFPSSKSNADEDTEIDESINPQVSMAAAVEEVPGIGAVIDATKYSTLSRLLRVTALVLKFIQNCRCFKETNRSDAVQPSIAADSQMSNDVAPGEHRRILPDGVALGEHLGIPTNDVAVREHCGLTCNNVALGEHQWVQYVQETNFPDCLSNKKHSTIVNHLGLFKDSNGIIRCHGRLRWATVSDEAKTPKLLPKNSWFTDLVIGHCHGKLYHAGVRQTLAQVRLQYWIPCGPSQVKKVLHQCRICRRAETGPFKVPESPPLPWFRVSRCHPFQHVGIDYLGPLLIRNIDTQKVWICIFTCAATRAIHLEVVTDAASDQFLMSLRRFVALYGAPTTIVSDNAKHFKLTDKVLQRLVTDSDIINYSTSVGINWKFITELAPWMGGFYERLVGSVKRALRKSLGSRCLTLVQLQTIVAEVSSIINSRPLVAVNSEVGEPVLTPANFLAKQGRIGLPEFHKDTDDTYVDVCQSKSGKQLLDQWAKGQKLLDDFWHCWKNEYLASLRDRPPPNLTIRNSSTIQPRPGVVVIIKDAVPRSRWKLGRIDEIHRSNDGQCRSATVRLPSGKLLKRAIRALFPLEDTDGEATDDPPTVPEPTFIPRRSLRNNANPINQQVDDHDDGVSNYSEEL